jgi:hypothetical protein
MSEALQDAHGCLTPAGFEALARAPLAQGPKDLVAHVAACARCQDRMLAADRMSAGPRREPPPPWRLVLSVGVIVILTVLLLVTARWFAG